MRVQVVDHLRKARKRRVIVREVEMRVHVVDVVPLDVVRHAETSHSLHDVPRRLRRIVAPATQVEAQRPIGRQKGTSDYLKRKQ